VLDILSVLAMMIENQATGAAMDRNQIENELRNLVREARSRDSSSKTGNTEPPIDNIIDSLEGVELALAAEQRYGVRIPDTELNRVCRSIPKIAEFIEKRLANQTRALGNANG
jgi:acyl carrier protein